MSVFGADLHSRSVVLTPVLPSDFDFLYSLSIDNTVNYRWRFRGAIPSFDEFARRLWDGVLTQYIVRDVGRTPVGLVVLYNAHSQGYVYLGLAQVPEARLTGLVLEGALLVVDLAFRLWPFRKIYIESLEMSFREFGSGLGRMVTEEGRLVEHEYFDGRYVDLIVAAIHRENWSLHGRPLLERLQTT